MTFAHEVARLKAENMKLTAELTALRARAEKAEKQLKLVVAVLCETRGHEGGRPCEYCHDMFLFFLPEEAKP